MRRKIVAGNWKMNLSLQEAVELYESLAVARFENEVELMVFPTSLYVGVLGDRYKNVRVGVQNFSHAAKGAYTGEQSIEQATSAGANIGLIGHSERREMYHETNEDLKAKVDAATEKGFNFVFCCGEPLEQRDQGNELEYVKSQLVESLFHLSKEQFEDVVIAYEPIWAIGTGRTASSKQAEEMHKAIRSWIKDAYDEATALNTPILYGGSCKPENAEELFACENVDGGLIGGASLKATSFLAIANSF